MQNTFFVKSPPLFFMAIMLLFASCNNNGSGAATTEAIVTTDQTPAAIKVPAAILSGSLDTLWMDAATFINLGPSTTMTFRFFDTLDAFTLRGWTGNPNSYNDKRAEVKLLKGRISTVKYGSGSYFGNIQISNQDYGTIYRLLNSSKKKYVVFGPIFPTAIPLSGQISYTISITDQYPGDLNPNINYKFLVEPTGVTTNPSPPKNGT